jgi:predicted dehydrogenase
MSESSTRRTFLKSAAGAGAALAFGGVAPSVQGQNKKRSANERLNVAFIATGGIAGTHLAQAERLGMNCVAYCDVDERRYGKAPQIWPKAKAYVDYRKMLDKHHKDIDAVFVGTPDFHHFPATMHAMQLGLGCYTQKPLTHTIWEARQLTEAYKRYKVPTQMGNQGHASESTRLVYEYIRSGMLGDIKEAHFWTNRPIWPQGLARPEGEDSVPSALDWNLWLGPAPKRPYKQGVYHAFKWRGWYDFGTGSIGDIAPHTMSAFFWAMAPIKPAFVEPATMSEWYPETYPQRVAVRWHVPATSERPAFDVYWHSKDLRPARPAEMSRDRDMGEGGDMILGTKGQLRGHVPFPGALRQELGKPPQMLERSPGHFDEFDMACRGEESYDFPKSNFAHAGPLSEFCLLGTLAIRANQRIEWDHDNMKVTNMDEANAWVNKDYRSGWRYSL